MRERIRAWIGEYIQDNLTKNRPLTTWEEPLVAIAAANDPLFTDLKRIVAPDHLLPTDLLTDAKSVITYFLPFSRAINLSNHKSRETSVEWARAYIETNQLIVAVNEYLSCKLAELKYRAAVVLPTHNFDQKTLISQWSHKHVAYIAGLGTFGINHLLITAKGCNGRLGSLVTDMVLAATPRPDFEFCLRKYNGSCGSCVGRCPQEVLAGLEFDRQKCYDLCLENAAKLQTIGLADVCGKCASQVPCSFTAPATALRRKQ